MPDPDAATGAVDGCGIARMAVPVPARADALAARGRLPGDEESDRKPRFASAQREAEAEADDGEPRDLRE